VPGSLAQQSCPAVFPDSLAQQVEHFKYFQFV
jgi:hypothetical protein